MENSTPATFAELNERDRRSVRSSTGRRALLQRQTNTGISTAATAYAASAFGPMKPHLLLSVNARAITPTAPTPHTMLTMSGSPCAFSSRCSCSSFLPIIQPVTPMGMLMKNA
ncbi:unannotated protein [freshwater metagenome]|uniref:Unannotated protein n=1 Tax=freshwater metagenome TaxID=449393 RepID=A0A6J7EVY9_9ZZZZ